MRNCRKHLQISSQFLRSCTSHKPFSSSSSSLSLSSPDPLISEEPSSISIEFPNSIADKTPNQSIPFSKTHQNVNLSSSSFRSPLFTSKSIEIPGSNDGISSSNSIPISKTHQNPNFLFQSSVIDGLLKVKNQPLYALKYYKEAENQSDFKGKVESFCVLLHILVDSRIDDLLEKKSLRNLFSNLRCSDPKTVIRCLVDASDRFGFTVNSRVFNALLNGFVSTYKIQDAVECLSWILENTVIDLGQLNYYGLFVEMFKRKRFRKAEELYDKMFSRGVFAGSKPFVGSKAICLMMRACVEQGKVQEAENWFIKAKESGVRLSAKPYSIAIDILCRKPDSSDAALKLLMEMKKEGLVPDKWSFVCVIRACVRQGKITEALIVRDAMQLSGEPMILTVVTSLIKGCCASGDLESALSLFKRMPEDGLSPDEVTFEALIEGCCRKGDVEKAGELYDQMVEKGIRPSPHTSVLMVKWFLNSRRLEKAYEHFMQAGTIPSNHNGKRGVVPANCVRAGMIGKGFRIDAFTVTIIIDGLFKMGKVDEAFKVFDEMSKRVVCTAFTYNTIIRWLCRLGQTSRAREMLLKFIKEGIFEPSCNTYEFIIEGFIKEGAIDSAMSVYTTMSENGVSPNESTCTMLVKGLCQSNNLDRALDLRKEIVNKGLEISVTAYEALIDGLWERKDTEKAYPVLAELLDAGLTPDKKIYHRMIAGRRLLPKEKKKRKKKRHDPKQNDPR